MKRVSMSTRAVSPASGADPQVGEGARHLRALVEHPGSLAGAGDADEIRADGARRFGPDARARCRRRSPTASRGATAATASWTAT